jgi:mRNA-degrading endonuclease toxin of MazEF toxin-antitoxin module
MKKDFQKWHNKKSDLDENKVRLHFHERDVWFTSVGLNIGYEQDGKGEEFLRPIVVFNKFNNETLWGIFLTKKKKTGKYYFSFEYNKEGEISTANLSQVRLIDSKRLKYQIGSISEKDFVELKKRIIALIG